MRGRHPCRPPETKLLGLAKGLSSASSYRVETSARTSRVSASTDAAKGPFAAEGREDGAWTIDYEAGKPLHFVSLTREFFRSDTQFAVPHPHSGKWFAVDRVKGDLSKAPRGHGDVARMFDQANAIALPHEWQDDFLAGLAEVQSAALEGGRTFTATLSEETAKKCCARFSVVVERTRPERERAGAGAAGGGAAAKPTATLTFTVVEGAIRSIGAEFTIPIEGSRSANLVKQNLGFSAVGTARVELPPDVATVLRLKK
ncbi:MAG: hypothetical protein EXS13_09240 [Planctomycetes bacterium]|nr:hypothetical protein [Planctomycetota bacterium]